MGKDSLSSKMSVIGGQLQQWQPTQSSINNGIHVYLHTVDVSVCICMHMYA